jgi:hypothetical protein
MVLQDAFVIGRPETVSHVTGRSSRRVTAMHRLIDGRSDLTACGRNCGWTSRKFLSRRQAEAWLILLCLNCKRAGV